MAKTETQREEEAISDCRLRIADLRLENIGECGGLAAPVSPLAPLTLLLALRGNTKVSLIGRIRPIGLMAHSTPVTRPSSPGSWPRLSRLDERKGIAMLAAGP